MGFCTWSPVVPVWQCCRCGHGTNISDFCVGYIRAPHLSQLKEMCLHKFCQGCRSMQGEMDRY